MSSAPDTGGHVVNLTTWRLDELEAVVAGGLHAFVPAGNALRKIRDEDLYKNAGFDTFEEYLRERWDISRGHAYRLIDGAAVVAVTGGVVKNLAQARELLPVLREEGDDGVRDVMDRIKDSGDKITAARIRQEVRPADPLSIAETHIRMAVLYVGYSHKAARHAIEAMMLAQTCESPATEADIADALKWEQARLDQFVAFNLTVAEEKALAEDDGVL
jgi:hypothetical protein